MEQVETVSCRNYPVASNMPLAISYVPMQKFVNVTNAADGFKKGTIFEDLYLNFYCTECINSGCEQSYYGKRTDYSNMGWMHGNTCRNSNVGCGNRSSKRSGCGIKNCNY